MRTRFAAASLILLSSWCASLVGAAHIYEDERAGKDKTGYENSFGVNKFEINRQQTPFMAGGAFAHQESYYGWLQDDEENVAMTYESDDMYDDGDDEDGMAGESSKPGWIYLIRHGEKFKDSDRSGLSAKGVMRAKCLVDVFGKNGLTPVDYIVAQDFKPTGQRKRPYDTVKPVAKSLSIPIDHSCDRDDTHCAASLIRKVSRRGLDVVVVWEHARLSNIARSLGVKGLHYPSKRYDVVFKIRKSKVHGIYSEECAGLDDAWFKWRGKRKSRHGKGGIGGRLVDDESWAEHPEETVS